MHKENIIHMADTANTNTNAWLPALKAAFPLTIPICLGFLFLGASYGILMGTKGFSFVWPMCMIAFFYFFLRKLRRPKIRYGRFQPSPLNLPSMDSP